MDFRSDRVPLSKIIFDIIPTKFVKNENRINEYGDLAAAYADCHSVAFNKPSVGYNPKYASQIIKNIRKSAMPSRLFILANMLGWKLKSPGKPFFAAVLSGDAAVNSANIYREACRSEFASFCETDLRYLHGNKSAGNSLEKIFLASEIIAGTWISTHKITNAGNPFAAFYAANELKLKPEWLAIEPHYAALVLTPHRENSERAKMSIENDHRYSVSACIRAAKRERSVASRYFEARQAVLPEAVKQVLSVRGMNPDDLEMKSEPVSDPMMLWWRMGLALQHVACLKSIGSYGI